MCQAILNYADGPTPIKELNEVWRKNTPRGAGSDYIAQAKRTGYEMDILTKYLYGEGRECEVNDCTDYILPLRIGDTVSIVEESTRGYFVKHNGISGWYFGELERD